MPTHDNRPHMLDCSEIDSLDEISGDEQLVLIWCETHRKHEWHWIPRDAINTDEVVRLTSKPVL